MDNPINNTVNMDKWLEQAKQFTYEMQAIEPPYDEYENELIRQIESIQREAYERAEPYRNRLVQSRMMKTATYVLRTEKRNVTPD